MNVELETKRLQLKIKAMSKADLYWEIPWAEKLVDDTKDEGGEVYEWQCKRLEMFLDAMAKLEGKKVQA